MSATNGNGAGTSAEVADAQPLMLLRYRPGVAGETARVVHLAPVPPGGAGTVSALCGTLLHPDQVETVNPGHGMPCTACILSHSSTSDTPPPMADLAPAPQSPSPDSATPTAAASRYQNWGWPVTLHRDQVRLHLTHDTVALIIPALLTDQVSTILRQRHCPPPVLAHPYAPEHRVLLAGERYGVSLPWPPGVHQVTGALLLPPTMTPRGPITWVHPPLPDALRPCREIEVLAVLRDLPPVARPLTATDGC